MTYDPCPVLWEPCSVNRVLCVLNSCARELCVRVGARASLSAAWYAPGRHSRLGRKGMCLGPGGPGLRRPVPPPSPLPPGAE